MYISVKKDNIHENSLQVINQYATEEGQSSNRYDVTVLVNGLPIVHIELKRRGVAIPEAFNQINRYQRESFWASLGSLNMSRYLSFPAARIQSTTAILSVRNISRKQARVQLKRGNDPVIVLNLLVGGRMRLIDRLRIS